MNLKHFIDGHEVVPGLRLRQQIAKTRFDISVHAICETVAPQTWRAEAKLGGTALFTTEPFPTIGQAARAAESEVESRLARLLSG